MPEMLSTAEIIRRTGWDPKKLDRYQIIPDLREWLGGKATHPKYPDASVPKFQKMLELANNGVTPKAMMGFLTTASATAAKNANGSTPDENPSGAFADDSAASKSLVPIVTRIMDMSAPEVDEVFEEAGGRFAHKFAREAVAALQEAGALPMPEDRLIGREEAALMLNCKPTGVARRVKPVAPGSWAVSMLQAYIRNLIKTAGEKEAVRARKKQERAAVPDAVFTVSESA